MTEPLLKRNFMV